MTIEVALVISALSVAFGIYQGITNNRRNQRADNMKDAGDMTTVIVKLENIFVDMAEIKTEVKGLRQDNRCTLERLIKTEESLKAAWRRLDVCRGLCREKIE